MTASTTITLPTFGLIAVETVNGANVAHLGHNTTPDLDDLDAAALRELAGNALAAACWLEGTTPTAPWAAPTAADLERAHAIQAETGVDVVFTVGLKGKALSVDKRGVIFVEINQEGFDRWEWVEEEARKIAQAAQAAQRRETERNAREAHEDAAALERLVARGVVKPEAVDMLGAIAAAEAETLARHEDGTCGESEFSCSHCEVTA